MIYKTNYIKLLIILIILLFSNNVFCQESIINIDTIYQDYKNNKYDVILKIKKKNSILNNNYNFYFIQKNDTIKLFQNTYNAIPLPLTNTKLLIKHRKKEFCINNFEKYLNPYYSNLIIITIRIKTLKFNRRIKTSSNPRAPDLHKGGVLYLNKINNIYFISVYNFGIISIEEIIEIKNN